MLISKINNKNIAYNLDDCLAKTYKTLEGEKRGGRRVMNHCRIVGEVARELLIRMPQTIKVDLFPDGSELIAATHDIGKVSPTFQEKINRGIDGYLKNSKPGLEKINPDIEKQWGGHAGVSQAAAGYLKLGKYIPEILGQHHGYSPTVNDLATDEVFGGQAWQRLREELIAGLKKGLHCEFPVVTHELQARVLAGFTTVSDWIGSGSLFNDPAEDWRPYIKPSLDNAGFIRPTFKQNLSFSDIFPGYEPHDVQQCLIEQVTQPGVYVLEAPMGVGKTEAALYAAYRMLASGQATGLYFALPTQLTSDKIHERVEKFLKQILQSDSANQQPLLLHGNAWLKAELGKEGNPGGSWFQASKRGILAPFAVGTIDQALMAVMNVKHGFVRTFGLVGKVVILDEVHSYDSYTGTILDELVKALRQMHCTVIILSATLTEQRRSTLLNSPLSNKSYPLISAAPNKGNVIEQSVLKIDDAVVGVQIIKDESMAIAEALLRAEQGQQVLWVENTVADAQRIYGLLARVECSPKVEYGLLHSRFLKTDREKNEGHWTSLYGKENFDERLKSGRILVGTQVLEQSLDIDADFLVSRFAPSDMLLQRMGRLWRHKATPRHTNAKREAWLLAPDLDGAVANPDQAFDKSAKVYSPYVLCRSLDVWQGFTQVAIPGQIRAIIDATYADSDETGAMLNHFNVLEKKRQDLQRMALVGLSKAGKTLSEEKASTRYSEQDSVEVLLIKSYHTDGHRQGVEIRFLDDSVYFLPNRGKGLKPLQCRELAAQLLKNTVRVADYLAPKPVAINNLSWLQDYLYLGKGKGDSMLRVAKVQDSDTVVSLDDGDASDKYTIEYNPSLGYQANK